MKASRGFILSLVVICLIALFLIYNPDFIINLFHPRDSAGAAFGVAFGIVFMVGSFIIILLLVVLFLALYLYFRDRNKK